MNFHNSTKIWNYMRKKIVLKKEISQILRIPLYNQIKK